MRRTSSLVLSAAACAASITTMVALGGPATAGVGPDVCRSTLNGGIVGTAVVASSSHVLGVAVPESQSVSIDSMTVIPSGEIRYRLAAPIRIMDVRSPDAMTFVGGVGYYVDSTKLDLSSRFLSCVGKRLKPSS